MATRPSTSLRKKEADRERRLQKIEQMLLRGIKDVFQISFAFGISHLQIRKDIDEIRVRWGAHTPEAVAVQRQERIAQIDGVLQLALNGFDRSRKDVEEFTTSVQNCDNCNGAGKVEDRPDEWKMCRLCGGKGKRISTQTKVKQSAGDPAFLTVAKTCIVEAAKLQGLVADSKLSTLMRVTERTGMTGEIRERVEELFVNAPTDAIINAMAALDQLHQASNPTAPKKIVLEAEASHGPSYHGDNETTPAQSENDDDRPNPADLRDGA